MWDQRTKQGFKEAVDPSFRCTELSSKAWSSKELIMLTDVVHDFKKEKKKMLLVENKNALLKANFCLQQQ